MNSSRSITAVCSSPLTPAPTIPLENAPRSPDRSQAGNPANAEPSRPHHPVAPSSDAVTRKVDTTGSISFAAASYRVGSTYRRKQVQVAVVDDQVQIAFEGTVIRTHPIRHDPTRQHGALANPAGRANRTNAA